MNFPTFYIFAIIIPLLLILWTTVSFWQRFMENLFFGTFRFDPTDTWITFWVAVVITTIYIFIVWVIKQIFYPRVDVMLVGIDREREQDFEPGDAAGVAGDRFSPSIVGTPFPGITRI